MLFLKEIVKGILLEGKASSFIKFYREIGRGYNPDDATIFDCLMTLKEYYQSYMDWYNKYPGNKKMDVEVISDFEKRLQEINVALESNDVKRKIIAVDNGINQWHIDMPIVRHLQLSIEDGEDDFGPEELEWINVENLLKTLGKMPDKSPYRRRYE